MKKQQIHIPKGRIIGIYNKFFSLIIIEKMQKKQFDKFSGIIFKENTKKMKFISSLRLN